MLRFKRRLNNLRPSALRSRKSSGLPLLTSGPIQSLDVVANFLPGQTSPYGTLSGFDVNDRYNELVVGFNNAMPRNFAGV